MDIRQLRQLSRKLMKANKTLIMVNERLYKDRKYLDEQNKQLRKEYTRELGELKQKMKAQMSSNDDIVDEEDLEELLKKKVNEDQEKSTIVHKDKELIIPELGQCESDVLQLEREVNMMKNDKTVIMIKYEKELEESESYFMGEQQKLRLYYEDRLVSAERQNQNLKSQINTLMSLTNDQHKKNYEAGSKELDKLRRLHQHELQEVERDLAMTLSQHLHSLSNLNEQEKLAIVKEKNAEIKKLKENSSELNEIITSLEEQIVNYPDLVEKCKYLEEQLDMEKRKHEDIHNENFKMLLNQGQEEKQDKDIPQEERCRNCGLFLLRAKELERELVALRKLEEDNVLLVSKNEKLVEQIEDEKLKLDMLTNGNLPDSESKMKLEELYSEKSPSKLKESSKKYLKKRVFQLENDCKDLWRKLQNEVVKNENKEQQINQEIIEKEELLKELQKTRVSTTKEKDFSCFNESSNTSVKDRNFECKPESTNMEKDDESCAVKEKLNKAEKRIRSLQNEIDRFHESYSNNLRKELENIENKWTQRLRQECDAIQSEMSEEFRKQKEEWHEKESELHSLIEELQIQIEEIEIERKQLENEIKIWKTSNEHEKLPNEESLTANFDRSSDIIIENNNIYRTPETMDQEYITDRDLRRLANKLKKDQWFRLANLLSIPDCEIQEIDKLKIGKDEKAFRALSEWRTSAEEISGNQVSQLTVALEEINRKDLVQFILHHRDTCKLRKKCIRI